MLADAKNLCPLQPVTARCVINSTQTSPVLIWGCDGQDGSKKERVILCSSSNVINLNCVEGEVQPTLVSCTCDSSTITSDVTFLATNGSWTLTCTDFSIEESPFQKNISFGIEGNTCTCIQVVYVHTSLPHRVALNHRGAYNFAIIFSMKPSRFSFKIIKWVLLCKMHGFHLYEKGLGGDEVKSSNTF